MITPSLDQLVGGACRESSIKIHYPEFYDYLLNTYPNLSFREKLYWYYNNLTESPRCICGNPVKFKNIKLGYQQYCCKKCLNNDPLKIQKSKQTCLEKYGDENFRNIEKSQQTSMSRYGVTNVMKSKEKSQQSINTRIERYGGCGNASSISLDRYRQTCLERYGVDSPIKNETIKQKVADTNLKQYGAISPFSSQSVKDKSIQTCLERYGAKHFSQSQEYEKRKDSIRENTKRTNLERYGVKSASQLDRFKRKSYNTKKINHTFNSSSTEEQFSRYLDSRNTQYIRQYKCDRYPFACDFYIPEYDLFLEINGTWTHGYHPYTDSEEDRKVVEEWRARNTGYYKNAIITWTERDIEKRNIAKQNNLNYLEVFSFNVEDIIREYERRVNIHSKP